MEYKWIKAFADQIKVDQINAESKEKYRKYAEKMIDQWKQKMKGTPLEDRFNLYYFNNTMKALKELKRCGDPADAEEFLTETIPKMCRNEISKDYCIFIAFLAKDQKIPLDDRLNGKYINLLNGLLKAADLSIVTNDNMEEILLTFAFRTCAAWEQWIDLQKEMKQVLERDAEENNRSEEDELHRAFGALREDYENGIKYYDLKRIVNGGLDDDEKKTRETYAQMTLDLGNIIEAYKDDTEKALDWRFDVIFKKHFRQQAEYASWRRQWYLYRILLVIVDHNITDVIEGIDEKNFTITGKPEDPKSLRAALNRCYLKTNYKEAAKKVDKKDPKKTLWSYLESCGKTSCEKLGEIYTDVLGETIFLNKQYSFGYYYEKKYEEYYQKHLNDDNYAEKRQDLARIGAYFFKTEEKMKVFMEKILDSKTAIGVRMGTRINVLMSDGGNVSREMLKLTALVARAHGCSEIDEAYIQHMLENCRYDAGTFANHPFDQYYEKAMKAGSAQELYELTEEFEENVLVMYHAAAFNNIIKGREVVSSCD